MCNIAGYVGTKQAAPILIDMIRKQEGLDGGCCTGISTIHEGSIYYAKVEGNLEYLLSNTDALSLPGTVGFIHSGAAFDGGEESSKENAGLFLDEAEPETIAWTRVNSSMYVACADHGTYIATAPLAFPNDSREPYLLPVWSSGFVKKEGFTCKTSGRQTVKIAHLTPFVKAETFKVVRDALLEGHKKLADLVEKVQTLFEEADYTQAEAAVYGALSDIYKEGYLKIETEYVSDVMEGRSVPRFYMTLEK